MHISEVGRQPCAPTLVVLAVSPWDMRMTVEQPAKKLDAASPGAYWAEQMNAIASRRDRAAFASLFDYFAPRVKSYLRRLGAGDAAADDLAQDVMLTVWRRAHQFDQAKASVSTWIFTIARNRRIDVLRRERRPEFDPSDPVLVRDPGDAADQVIEAEQRDRSVRDAVTVLPEEQAALLRLAYYEDKSHSEIAGELGLPLGTVKSRLRLAMVKLRVMLKED